jgi:glyoxylase-like metal-dependent hydrolase (beta-lactamase superfamily II)
MGRALVPGAMLAAFALVATVAARQALPLVEPIGQIQKVRNNLYMVPGQGGNTAIFVTRTGVVLVDTKLSGNGASIMERVAAVSDVPVTMIINTSSDADHVGSNEFFSPSVEIVTHENTKKNMARVEALREAPQAMPDRTFTDRLTIGRGQDQIDLYYFGAGHTNGDAVVVFPAVRAMHAGDLFASDMPPQVDRANGGSATAFPDTLENAVKTLRNVDTVIPGHADVTTWSAFVGYAARAKKTVAFFRGDLFPALPPHH